MTKLVIYTVIFLLLAGLFGVISFDVVVAVVVITVVNENQFSFRVQESE